MTEQESACYVYGIVPADVETDPEARGVGNPVRPVEAIRHGEIAALVSEITLDRALGEPQDLAAHARVLDATSAEVPVLPLRFGAVLSDRDAVENELLAAHHDEFRDALRELEGRAEYVLRGRYVEETILREVLAENEQAQQLREAMRNKPAEAARNERMALGELLNQAIAAKRDADNRTAVKALESYSSGAVVRDPTHEEDAVHVAVLAEVAAQGDLEEVVADLGERWQDRVELRLLGPLAPYDFVVTTQPAEG